MAKEQTKLKEILREKKISAYRLAKECDINQAPLYSMINGNLKAFPKWKEKISAYLEIPQEELFIDDED